MLFLNLVFLIILYVHTPVIAPAQPPFEIARRNLTIFFNGLRGTWRIAADRWRDQRDGAGWCPDIAVFPTFFDDGTFYAVVPGKEDCRDAKIAWISPRVQLM